MCKTLLFLILFPLSVHENIYSIIVHSAYMYMLKVLQGFMWKFCGRPIFVADFMNLDTFHGRLMCLNVVAVLGCNWVFIGSMLTKIKIS